MSDSIQVEPFEPDEAVPIDGLAAELTDSVGLSDDAGASDLMRDSLASEVESYQEHADRRDQHMAEQEGDDVDEQVDDQPQGKGQRHVPLGALQDERSKRQAAQEQVRQLQARLDQVLQLQQLQAQQQQQVQQQAQEEQIPAFIDDPEGHVKGLTKQFEQRLNDMQGQQQHAQQLERAAAQVQRVAQEVIPFVADVEPRFRAAHADYDAAREHVQANIRSQLAAQHPGATAEQIQGLQNVYEIAFIHQCMANGIDPCAHVYQRAQALGFQSAHRSPQGQIKQAPTSLSNLPGGGRAPDEQGAITASRISQMSNAEFDEMFERMRAADAPRFGF